MIYNDAFVWLHFPRCAGTKIEFLFRDYYSEDKSIFQDLVDDKIDQSISWHNSIAQRESGDSDFTLGDRIVICSFRKLPAWLKSRYNFEYLRSPGLSHKPELLLEGEFLEANGYKNHADYYARKYLPPEIIENRSIRFLRAEYFESDFKEIFSEFIDISIIPEWEFSHRINKAKSQIPDEIISKLSNNCEDLYKKCPYWHSLEKIAYPDGDGGKFCEKTGIKYLEKSPNDISPEEKDLNVKIPVSGEKLLGNKINDDVHVGKEGWLFLRTGTNNSLSYYLAPDLFTEEMINNWINLLRSRINYFQENEIAYAHLFAPNKLTIYPEFYRGDLPFFTSSPLQKLFQKLVDLDLRSVLDHVVNPIEYFNNIKKDQQLYWKTDTHWTFWGVFGAYQLICKNLGYQTDMDLLKRDRKTTTLVMDTGGKLNPPVSEQATFFQPLVNAKRIYANPLEKYKEDRNYKNIFDYHVGSNVVFENPMAKIQQKVILFGDSFSESRPHLLTGALAETFREVHFVWSVNLDYGYIKDVQPDIVISENVERFMPRVPTDTFNLKDFVRNKLSKISDK